MNKLSYLCALSVASLAACSSASGPTYSVSELQARDGMRTFQVDCHGLLSGSQTCMKAARRICADQPVRVIDSARAPRNNAVPATLVFQCGETPAPIAVVPRVEPAVAPAAPPAPPAPIEHLNLSGDALFATGQATLTPKARASLDTLLSGHAGRRYAEVTVTGYTDSVGRDAYNLTLSRRRADTVAAYLQAHGLQADKLSVAGRGKADPIASNATAEGRAGNRRVEISLRG
ncbi:OmpA family protein [Burkholderia sp. Ap-962]|uniref:OmpA family protein n=1 Tax=Burkholderia sp. Ap-962 TaxID=2608333 RepID=UPI00141FAEAF|nr:OmpA family protein [Burkholderia sp. Ap-962]NIF69773.1 OmpA family protein [Burkholderia sp. Ap-962]